MSFEIATHTDNYNGMHVNMTGTAPVEDFESIHFPALLHKANHHSHKAMWIRLNKEQTHFIPVLLKNNFYFHHAVETHVMMCCWFSENLPNPLPKYPSFQIGIGGFVVNEKNEVLVVQEKNGPFPDLWKLPTGHVEPNEDLDKAAIREVFEETGIKTEFESILSFRQHNFATFKQADIYFVIKLKPLTSEIRMCEIEIRDCKWMPIEEYFSLPFYRGVWAEMMKIQKESLDPNYNGGFQLKVTPSGISRATVNLYASFPPPSSKL